MSQVSVQVEALPITMLVGSDVPELLQASDYPVPGIMQVARLPGGFIARTGKDEFLLQTEKSFVCEKQACWCYSREDRTFILKGALWREVMAYICHMDLSEVNKDDWLMMSVAGVNTWALVIEEGLLMGCDPSLGEYVASTLNETVQRVNQKFN